MTCEKFIGSCGGTSHVIEQLDLVRPRSLVVVELSELVCR